MIIRLIVVIALAFLAVCFFAFIARVFCLGLKEFFKNDKIVVDLAKNTIEVKDSVSK